MKGILDAYVSPHGDLKTENLRHFR